MIVMTHTYGDIFTYIVDSNGVLNMTLSGKYMTEEFS
jgi:hypothetical protein